ncbi:hypothetical protein FPOAC2_00678 [Fusarium poae]
MVQRIRASEFRSIEGVIFTATMEDFQNKRGDHSEANSTHQKKGVIFRAHFFIVPCLLSFFASSSDRFQKLGGYLLFFAHRIIIVICFCISVSLQQRCLGMGNQKLGREAICLFVVQGIICIITKVVEKEEGEALGGSDLLLQAGRRINHDS